MQLRTNCQPSLLTEMCIRLEGNLDEHVGYRFGLFSVEEAEIRKSGYEVRLRLRYHANLREADGARDLYDVLFTGETQTDFRIISLERSETSGVVYYGLVVERLTEE